MPSRAALVAAFVGAVLALQCCAGGVGVEGRGRPTATPCATQETIAPGVTRGCGALVRHRATPIAPRRVTPTAGRGR
jgi:hypothetical protein